MARRLDVDEGRRSHWPGDESRELVLLLAAPRGFCAGVRRAIDAVRDALAHYGPPVFVRRAIVHNMAVVDSLKAQGAIFVQELSEVPEGAVVILSAHGVPPQVQREALERNLVLHDAVCPLVAKVHRNVERHHRNGRHVVLVGHRDHPETIGTLGHVPAGAASVIRDLADVRALVLEEDASIGLAVQTTYSIDEAAEVSDALAARFPNLARPSVSDICYASTNRQAAVRAIATRADAILVVGESFSSNACRLAEVATAAGCPSVQLVAEAAGLDWESLPRSGTIGLTAAASTPESSTEGIIAALRSRFRLRIEEISAVEETMMFKPVPVPAS